MSLRNTTPPSRIGLGDPEAPAGVEVVVGDDVQHVEPGEGEPLRDTRVDACPPRRPSAANPTQAAPRVSLRKQRCTATPAEVGAARLDDHERSSRRLTLPGGERIGV